MPSSPDNTNDGMPGSTDPTSHLDTSQSSCPPEIDRSNSAPGEGTVWMEPGAESAARWHATRANRATQEYRALRANLFRTSGSDELDDTDAAGKRLRDIDEALMRAAASPSEPADSSDGDSDTRLAQSMSAAALSSSASHRRPYETESLHRIRPNVTSSFLRPGSKFVGTQNSDRQRYNVQVELKDVDMEQSFLCGYLRIQGLTDDHPTLTTFFEGEIIGNKHTFKTAHPEWGSSEKVDMQHWARFPAWRPLAQQAQSPGFTFKNYAQHEYLFMRWKEYFLVPDHKVKTITGASFEGFYYICFNQSAGSVTGIYFHSKSEKYQQLELEHVKDRGCMGAMEFR